MKLNDRVQDYSPGSSAASSNADEDRQGAVLLSGPVGAGKTALVYAAAQVKALHLLARVCMCVPTVTEQLQVCWA